MRAISELTVFATILMLTTMVQCGQRNKEFVRDESFSDRKCWSYDRIFTESTSSTLMCTSLCQMYSTCKSVFYVNQTGTCHGCDNVYSSASQLLSEMGAVYYMDKGKYSNLKVCKVLIF